MNAPGKIVLYFVAVFVFGALLAPPLYWGVMALKNLAENHPAGAKKEDRWIYYEERDKPLKPGDRPLKAGDPREREIKTRGPLRWLDANFGKIADRASIFVAVVLLWPLLRSLRIRSTAELGLRPNPHRWRDFATAYAAAAGLMLLLALALLWSGLFVLKKPTPWADLWMPALSGLGVGILEEWIFRGAFLGTIRQSMKPWPALAAVSALFAIVHFIQPRERAETLDVTWWTGFELLPHRFESFSEPGLVLGGFVTLFAFGWVCGWATIRTGSLWMAIGFHAGMVLGKFGFNRIAERSDGRDLLPWLGEDMAVGIVAVGVVALVGGLLWLYLRYVARSRREDPR